MLALTPIELEKIESGVEKDAQILRLAMISELDAINLYEQMAEQVSTVKVKELLENIADEERIHLGEFQAILITIDDNHVQGLKKGKLEVDKILKIKSSTEEETMEEKPSEEKDNLDEEEK